VQRSASRPTLSAWCTPAPQPKQRASAAAVTSARVCHDDPDGRSARSPSAPTKERLQRRLPAEEGWLGALAAAPDGPGESLRRGDLRLSVSPRIYCTFDASENPSGLQRRHGSACPAPASPAEAARVDQRAKLLLGMARSGAGAGAAAGGKRAEGGVKESRGGPAARTAQLLREVPG
jgi:hypothetical protein